MIMMLWVGGCGCGGGGVCRGRVGCDLQKGSVSGWSILSEVDTDNGLLDMPGLIFHHSEERVNQ